MTALASLGVLTEDEGVVEAVLAEIDDRGIDQPDPEGSLAYLRSLVKLANVSIRMVSILQLVADAYPAGLRTTLSARNGHYLQRYISTRPTSRASCD